MWQKRYKTHIKLFSNLFPDEKPLSLERTELESRNGKWVEIRPDGKIRSASGRYDFVHIGGKIYISKANRRLRGFGHIKLSQGRPVEYAGQVQFSRRGKRGTICWWNNDSGHYKPSPKYAHQAFLPMEAFRDGGFETFQSGFAVSG